MPPAHYGETQAGSPACLSSGDCFQAADTSPASFSLSELLTGLLVRSSELCSELMVSYLLVGLEQP